MSRIFACHLMKSLSQARAWLAIATILLGIFGLAQTSAAQAIIFVTATQQGITGASSCSLQEAIYSAEFGTNKAINSTDPDSYYTTGCVPGTGNGDTIVLPSDAVLSFSQFWDGDAHNIYGQTATPVIFTNIIIDGNYSTLQWTGTGSSRLFAIGTVKVANFGSGTGSLTLRNAYIKGFHVKGGNGGDGGGGGGLGAGGAIYVNDGGLTVENSTFDGNGAVGGAGNGSSSATEGVGLSGGGGGLSGNGGIGSLSNGGGGGGSRGNGGSGTQVSNVGPDGGGGGGGGTVFSGGNGTLLSAGLGGYLCGGDGGDVGDDGHAAKCAGGGGGGGGGEIGSNGNGGNGAFGGGGGGGNGDGGNGGFGGGGGGGFEGYTTVSGGNGGFGGGGGGVYPSAEFVTDGEGGPFGGNAISTNGGGGGALGGAIFNDFGIVRIENCTFANNYVTRGLGGNAGKPGGADNGADAGGAIFSYGRSLDIIDSTFSNNHGTGSGAAVVFYSTSTSSGFSLNDSIIANNGANACYFTGPLTRSGAGNLIMNNGSGEFSPCPGVVSTANPGLGPLQINQGAIPTMAISKTSPAWNAADPGTSLATDERGQARPSMGGFDIGAFELCENKFDMQCIITAGNEQTEPLTMQISPAAGGSTTPAAGLTNEPLGSVAALMATASHGYTFAGWTGNVTATMNSSTTIIMDNAQTVTANFAVCTCAGSVSASVTLTFGAIVLNASSGRYTQTVTVKNTSANTITGPISLVLDGLNSDVTLFNETGTTDAQQLPAGSPYINAIGNLAAGQKIAIGLQFTAPSQAEIAYSTRVLAGPGAR